MIEEGEKMVALYVKRIREGKMNIEQVPAKWREAVERELKK